MFKLVTGSPGDGKTSNELWDFLHAPEYKGRPKFCTPINGFEPEKHGVQPIEHIKDWQDLPDGSVIFVDEVQDYMGARSSREPPEWIKQLARHRHRGFDFIVTTQSPLFLDQFVRKLAKPHVHYIRPWNLKCSRYTWDTVQNDPTTKSAKAAGQSKLVTPNPEVFKLYTSTVLDTHKARPPWKIIIVGVVALVLCIGGVTTAVYTLGHLNDDIAPSVDAVSAVAAPEGQQGTFTPVTAPASTWTVESTKPRIDGLAWTAPVYDSLTAPTDFPRVAACTFSKRTGCDCYSQQATRLEIPESACLVYVKEGSFDPWLSGRKSSMQAQTSPPAAEEKTGVTDEPRHEVRRDSGLTIVESGKPGHLW